MKSLLKSIILFSALYSQALAATTYTTHYSLAKPSDGSTSWGSDIRNNFDTIDTQMYVANNSLANHIADTTGAHAATAISTTVGGSTCTSADDVQEFLDCLDTNFGILIGGNVMTTNTTQTVTGPKTFTQVITGTNGFSLTGGLSLLSYGDGILHTVSGGVTSSSVINADVSASAAIARTKLASGSNNHVIINDGSGVLSSEAQLAVSRGGTGIASGTSGGITYFSSSSTIASSSLLPLNAVIVGGGAAAAPSPLPTGTPYQALRIPSGGGAPAFGALDVSQSAAVTGALSASNGGTGLTSPGTSGNILTSNGSSWTSVAPSSLSVVSKTSTYAILTTDNVILVDGTSAFTVTLPTAVGVTGKAYTIKRTDQTLANAVTIATTSAQTIDGITTRKLMTQNESFTVISDGSNWFISDHTISSVRFSFTPNAYAGLGTPTINKAIGWREGSFFNAEIDFAAGTTTATEARFGLPSGLTTTSDPSTLQQCGEFLRFVSSSNHGGYVLFEASKTYVTFSSSGVIGGATVVPVSKVLGNDFAGNGEQFTVRFKVPITNWEP